MKKKNATDTTLIERLTLVLSTLSSQLDAAIKEIDDTNIAAIAQFLALIPEADETEAA